MNGLLVASGSVVLCLHDHNFVHLATAAHTDHGDDCQIHHDETNAYSDVSGDANFFETSPQCFDIVISPSEELIRYISDSHSPKKRIILASYQYEEFERASTGNASLWVRLASRAPPNIFGTLEQCVRRTVLRL